MEIPFNTIEEGREKLEIMVQAREKARGCRWFRVWQRDCNRFADKLIRAGANREDIYTIMSWTSNKDCYCGVMWGEKS